MMVLQNCMDLPKAECSLCAEESQTSHCDKNQDINVKVESVTDAEGKEDPLQITLPEMKPDHVVSRVYCYYKHGTDIQDCIVSACQQFVHSIQLHCGE
jgi:hypothetical protein